MYALDERQRIVFVNHALCDWLGVAAEDLLDRTCHYGSPRQDDPIACLCPPPEAILAGALRMTIQAPAPEGASQSSWRRRHATVITWSDEETLEGIFVLLDGNDVDATAEPTQPAGASEDLHLQVAQLRALLPQHATLHLLGDSVLMHRVRQQVEAAATTRASVLISGEDGVGREEVAKAVYYGGDTSHGLLPLSCQLLDAELLASALEDLERSHLELTESPDTILLLDVDQLPTDAQDPIYRRLRRLQPVPRLLATARQTLAEIEFHQDFAVYLSDLAIHLPALRERREDIPQLAQFVLQDANAERPRQLSGFDDEAMDLLVAYPWFENHDELLRLVQEATLNAQANQVVASDLPHSLRAAHRQAAHPPRQDEPIDLPQWLEEIERDVIARALERSKGNKAAAARLLGLQRNRLLRRIEALNIRADED